jgi:GNAT superfamily N-acetyltransferase
VTIFPLRISGRLSLNDQSEHPRVAVRSGCPSSSHDATLRFRGRCTSSPQADRRTDTWYRPIMPIDFEWRGDFIDLEIRELHAEAFETSVHNEAELNWSALVNEHSLGWVVARNGRRLVGFANVPWDGRAHAWIQDTMVAKESRLQGVGTQLVSMARDQARGAGCQWLHVDFDDHLRSFYFKACGFTPTTAGLIALRGES